MVPEVPVGGVIAEAPARVHFGLLQMSHAYSTSYMGIGGAVHDPAWSLHLTASSDGDEFNGLPEELANYAWRVCQVLRAREDFSAVSVEARRTVPPHTGLGAKTSFGCALIAGLVELFGLPGNWDEYRHLLSRAGTSGVGINTAVTGGIILDAGHASQPGEQLLPSSARPGKAAPPAAGRWDPEFLPRVVLARPAGVQGLHGPAERALFTSRLPLLDDDVRAVAGLVLYEILPALARRDVRAFVGGLAQLQNVGFKRVEWEIQPESVLDLRRTAVGHGATVVALSGMGPTLVLFAADPVGLARSMGTLSRVHVAVSSFVSTGARVSTVVT
jgi:beta-ribofuranosylaminobenzene 5'-phosphate synthase